MAPLHRSSDGWLPARTYKSSVCGGVKHLVSRRKASLTSLSMRRVWALRPEMGIYRDNLRAIVIGDNLMPIIVIAQNSFALSITDIAFVPYFVIADKLPQ